MKKEIPFWEKSNLTVEEAAAYFNIGINKMKFAINDIPREQTSDSDDFCDETVF